MLLRPGCVYGWFCEHLFWSACRSASKREDISSWAASAPDAHAGRCGIAGCRCRRRAGHRRLMLSLAFNTWSGLSDGRHPEATPALTPPLPRRAVLIHRWWGLCDPCVDAAPHLQVTGRRLACRREREGGGLRSAPRHRAVIGQGCNRRRARVCVSPSTGRRSMGKSACINAPGHSCCVAASARSAGRCRCCGVDQ